MTPAARKEYEALHRMMGEHQRRWEDDKRKAAGLPITMIREHHIGVSSEIDQTADDVITAARLIVNGRVVATIEITPEGRLIRRMWSATSMEYRVHGKGSASTLSGIRRHINLALKAWRAHPWAYTDAPQKA